MEKLIENKFILLVSSIGFSKFDSRVCQIFREIGFKKVGISVLGGMAVDIKKAVSNIRKNTFDHYCGDIPDDNWNIKRIKYDWEMVNRDRPALLDYGQFGRYFKRLLLQMIVWRFFSVASQKGLLKSVNNLVLNTTCINCQKWIRWDSRGVVENLELINKLPNDLNIIVEYYPESHHPDEFVEFIRDLNKKFINNFWISFDAGHFHRARYMYKDCINIPCEYWLMEYVIDPQISGLIKMVELSNLPKEGQNAHFGLYDGAVDFQKIFCMIGWALRNKRIDENIFVVLEATPMNLSEIIERSADKFNKYFRSMVSDQMFYELKDKF